MTTALLPHRASLVLALALLATVGLAGPAAAQNAPGAATAASAPASAPAEGVRPALFGPLTAAQQLLGEQRHADALARLKEADAVPNPTPYEIFVTERLRLAAALGVPDLAQAEQALQRLTPLGRTPPAERAQFVQALLGAHYRAKSYPRAAAWARELRQDPAASPAMRTQAQHLLPQALYLAQDYAGAAAELIAERQAAEAAGQVPAEDRLRLLASSQAQRKDLPGYLAAMEGLVRHHPSKAHWSELIGRITAAEDFAERLLLDALRLKAVVAGGLDEADDLLTLAEMAQQAGQSIEARRWVQQGYASGRLGSGAQAAAHAKLRDAVQRSAADDEATLRKGPAAKEAVALASWGQSYIAAGQVERGLAMMEEALAKGGLKRAEDLRLRLGAAYAQAGRTDAAVRHLQAVQGSDGTAALARLWLLHLKQPLPAR